MKMFLDVNNQSVLLHEQFCVVGNLMFWNDWDVKMDHIWYEYDIKIWKGALLQRQQDLLHQVSGDSFHALLGHQGFLLIWLVNSHLMQRISQNFYATKFPKILFGQYLVTCSGIQLKMMKNIIFVKIALDLQRVLMFKSTVCS